MFENKDRTPLSKLGEFGLIEHLATNVTHHQTSTLKGIGDDAAVLDNGDGTVTLVSTDLLAEGVHFDLAYVPLKHLGYKAVAVNLSDIYAMNGRPAQITVSMALSSRFPVEAVEELYAGIIQACNHYGVDLVGGDTSTSRAGLILSITAIGKAQKEKVAYRSGAQEHNLLVVSGDLGSAYMGLQVLERERSVFKDNPDVQPDLEGHDYILERQLKPEPRKVVIDLLEKAGIVPTSMIDVSDGLASDVLHICKQSQKGCAIYVEKIPIDYTTASTAEEFNLDPLTCALNGGEDYELLFTIRQSDFDKLKEIQGLHVIGHITEKSNGCILVTQQNQHIEIKAQGWNHFEE